jgi:hypothetical protein
MSITTKKTSGKGVRYSDAQKKEVVDFALSYNAANGRGGQSKAAEKFGISQLSVASWLKGSGAKASKEPKGAKAPKAAKAAKAAKAPKAAKAAKIAKTAKAPKAAKSAGKKKPGSRYTDEQKQEVTDFVQSYNAANGRGGASTAAKKFSVSPLTVVAWLKAAGVNGSSKKVSSKGNKYVAPGKVAKVGKKAVVSSGGGMSAKLNQLLSLSDQIADVEGELAELKAKFNSLKASL